MAMSGSGEDIAIGSPGNDKAGEEVGMVHVFELKVAC